MTGHALAMPACGTYKVAVQLDLRNVTWGLMCRGIELHPVSPSLDAQCLGTAFEVSPCRGRANVLNLLARTHCARTAHAQPAIVHQIIYHHDN